MRSVWILVATLWATAANCETATITLKDGSVVRGEITAFVNQTYAVESESLGRIQVRQSDVSTIRYGAGGQAPAVGAGTTVDSGELLQLQRQMMSNPGIMSSIQGLRDDPQIQAVLSDPEIVRAISSGNIQALMSNPKFMQLMNHPSIRSITSEVTGSSGGR